MQILGFALAVLIVSAIYATLATFIYSATKKVKERKQQDENNK